MRLLNSYTLKFEDFLDDRVPTYAILSHRWQDDEVSFLDMQRGTATNRAGYSKIKNLCDLARKQGFTYAWVDTCCIDKSSSAELSEAINSMYQWYQKSAVCYVYLFDVPVIADGLGAEQFRKAFWESVWWTRGWTLQELIAPSEVEFYDSAWQYMGNKSTLKANIVSITGIDEAMLEGASPESFSLAKRMSWAAKRTTTRVEDMAYSLLGIFSVNMPMLYGEGDRAFLRLQEEIMKQSDDHSLFAWSSTDENSRGLLARSPLDFQSCNKIVPSEVRWIQSPYSITNLGLSIDLPMVGWAMDTYLAALDCQIENAPKSRLGIFLRLLPDSKDRCVRVRVDGEDIRTFDEDLVSQSKYRKIYVRQKHWGFRDPIDKIYGFWCRKLPLDLKSEHGENKLVSIHSRSPWQEERGVLEIPNGHRGTAGMLWNGPPGYGVSFLKLGFDSMYNPVCELGGPLWGKTAETFRADDDEFGLERRIDNRWISDDPHPFTWYYKGDRLTGLSRFEENHYITITQGEIEGRRVWVVNVGRPEWFPALNKPSRAICDSCGEVSRSETAMVEIS
jgi:hypothetical protein